MNDVTCPEEWRPVVGYEGRYEVSSLGRVKSTLLREPRILRPGIDRYGYQLLALHKDGKQTTRKVHVLVARAFHGSRPAGLDVMHLDGDSLNNAVANLAYGSRSQNLLDAVRHGTNHWASKTHCPRNHPYSPENTYIRPGSNHRTCRACQRARR
jgi:hypothetical protein